MENLIIIFIRRCKMFTSPSYLPTYREPTEEGGEDVLVDLPRCIQGLCYLPTYLPTYLWLTVAHSKALFSLYHPYLPTYLPTESPQKEIVKMFWSISPAAYKASKIGEEASVVTYIHTYIHTCMHT